MMEYLPIVLGMALFFAIVFKMGGHTVIINALDERGKKIETELAEAKRLREEAQKLVAEYKRKQVAAEKEAADIVTAAKAEAERISAEAKAKMDDFVTRRTAMAKQKIAQAEAQAVAEVRAAAADVAVQAAGAVLGEMAKGKSGEDMVAAGIAEVKARLN